MTTKNECLEALRGFVERADRAELAEAQAAIIQYALGAPDLASRTQAMADLQAALAEAVDDYPPGSIQQAYHAVVDAMIDRTRDAVMQRRPG